MERFSALVLTRDSETLRVINKAFEEYGLEANIVGNVRDANELLKDRRFDLAVCDCDFPGAQQLAYFNPDSAWRGMVFALIGKEQLSNVRGYRAHLTLPKPLTQGLFSKGLKAAYTTMAHERRAAFRSPVEADATTAELVDRDEQQTLSWARVVNVSRTGMRLQTRELLPQHATVRLSFELPENRGLISVEGEVVWAKAPGQAGVRFTHLPATSQRRLTDWLEALLPPEFAV